MAHRHILLGFLSKCILKKVLIFCYVVNDIQINVSVLQIGLYVLRKESQIFLQEIN